MSNANPTKTSRWQRFKTWMKDPDHQAAVFVTSAYTLIIGGTAYLAYVVAKEQSEAVDAYNQAVADAKEHEREIAEWATAEWNEGNSVYQISERSYLVLPRDAKQEIVNK